MSTETKRSASEGKEVESRPEREKLSKVIKTYRAEEVKNHRVVALLNGFFIGFGGGIMIFAFTIPSTTAALLFIVLAIIIIALGIGAEAYQDTKIR